MGVKLEQSVPEVRVQHHGQSLSDRRRGGVEGLGGAELHKLLRWDLIKVSWV